MQKKTFLIIICFLFSMGCKVQFNKILQKKYKSILGSDFKEWDFYSSSFSNYGIGTLYRDLDDNGKLSKAEARPICGMWGCVGETPPKYPNADSPNNEWLSYYGLSDYGETGLISLTDNEKRKYNLEVLLPGFFRVLGINAKSGQENIVQSTLLINAVYKRTINENQYTKRILGLDSNNSIKNSFQKGELFVTVQDLVFDGFTSTITVSKELENKINTELVKSDSKVFSGGSSLNFKLQRSGSGRFIIEAKTPLIVARRIVKQRGEGLLNSRGWSKVDRRAKLIPLNN